MKLAKSFIVIVAICSVVLFALSCRKTYLEKHEVEVKIQVKPTWAEKYFIKSLLPKQGNVVDPSINSTNSLYSELKAQKENMKMPIWQKAVSQTSKIYEIVEVPLIYTTKVTPMIYPRTPGANGSISIDEGVAKASFDRLVIYKNKNGQISQRIVSYVPSKEYLARHKGDASRNLITKIDKDFEGLLFYRDWNGRYLFALKMQNGKAVKKFSMLSNKMNFKPIAFQEEENCVTMEVYEWFQDCYYETDNPNPIYCSEPYPVFVYSYEYCPDPIEDPCLDPEYVDTGDCYLEYTPVAVIANLAKLCGHIPTLRTGNHYSGGVDNLGFTMQVTKDGYTESYPVVIGSSCFNVSASSSTEASLAFITAYNSSVDLIMNQVKYGALKNYNSVSLRTLLINYIKVALIATGGGGASFSSGGCSGTTPQTVANYCN